MFLSLYNFFVTTRKQNRNCRISYIIAFYIFHLKCSLRPVTSILHLRSGYTGYEQYGYYSDYYDYTADYTGGQGYSSGAQARVSLYIRRGGIVMNWPKISRPYRLKLKKKMSLRGGVEILASYW